MLMDTSKDAETRKDLKTLLEAYERSLILEALAEKGGNQRQAAFALGILPTTLHEKLKRLGIRPRAEVAAAEPAEAAR
jgi:DNA-binding NtrC family response regulator